MKLFKPMLAHTINDVNLIEYPVMVSPKLDGIRALVFDGIVYSRSMKPIRSETVQRLFGKKEYEGFDGELIYGNPTDKDVFNKSTSFCMSKDIPEGMTEAEIDFWVFDIFIQGSYVHRAKELKNKVSKITRLSQICLLQQTECRSPKELLNFETRWVDHGFEGVIVRSFDGPYKQGRSTEKQGIMGKIKRFSDSEAKIIGFNELYHNENTQIINELGYSERSVSKEGLFPANTLGSLIVKDIKTGVEFEIGSGFNQQQRQHIWDNKNEWIGCFVKYKYFDVQSGYDKPRFPIFLGKRDIDDIGGINALD